MIWCGFERLLNLGVGLMENCSSLCMRKHPFNRNSRIEGPWRTRVHLCLHRLGSYRAWWFLYLIKQTKLNWRSYEPVIWAMFVGLFCTGRGTQSAKRNGGTRFTYRGPGIPLNASFQVLWSSWDAVWWIWESDELIYGWYKFHWYKYQLISPFQIYMA